MGWLVDFLRSAGDLDKDLLPDMKGYDAKSGVLGAIRQMGRDVEELGIDMSKRAIDRGALNQLHDSGAISDKEYKALMNRLHHLL